jgi:hypothetical protein
MIQMFEDFINQLANDIRNKFEQLGLPRDIIDEDGRALRHIMGQPRAQLKSIL